MYIDSQISSLGTEAFPGFLRMPYKMPTEPKTSFRHVEQGELEAQQSLQFTMPDAAVKEQAMADVGVASSSNQSFGNAEAWQRHGKVLIPQPEDDMNDPLRWSQRKKLSILLMLGVVSFMADYAAATGATAIVPQAEEWHTSPSSVNHATAGNTFMLGVGGIATVIFSAYIGRLPALFYFCVFAVATAAWEAAAQGTLSYTIARVLNGFFAVTGAGGGMMWIEDMFFVHERPKAVNFWSWCLIASPFVGPCVMAAILSTTTWRVGMWTNFGVQAFAFSLVLLLGEESFFSRHLPEGAVRADIYSKPRIYRLLGIEQMRTNWTTNTLREAAYRPLKLLSKPAAVLALVYYFFNFGWVIGNNTTISVFVLPVYGIGDGGLAILYLAPILGGIISGALGHFMFDLTAKLYTKLAGGNYAAEARLIPIFLTLPLQIVGYNLIGFALDRSWSIWILAVGWVRPKNLSCLSSLHMFNANIRSTLGYAQCRLNFIHRKFVNLSNRCLSSSVW